MRLTAFILAAALVPAAVSAEQISALGAWTVTGVASDPSMPVTAVGDGDPAYLGAKLTVSRDRIGWDTAATNGSGTYDDCAGPRFAAGASGVAVTCGGAPWGPPGAGLVPVSANELRLTWFDGGILTLTRD